MHVVLIQPPDPIPAVTPLDSANGDSIRFAPPWSLLCLRAYLLNRTGHACTFIDGRLFHNLEQDLKDAIGAVPQPRVLVVNISTEALGEAAAIVEIAKRAFPTLPIIACGDFPSQFPKQVAGMPHIDYGMAGDPEPILRSLLDNFDAAHRMRRIPGLIGGDAESVEPYWLPDLKSLTLPDWQGIFWPAYEDPMLRQGCRAEIRLSRGHTREAADRAFGPANEPLRLWPFERAAALLIKGAHLGIVEIFVADPPGFWTNERLRDWCAALRHVRNTRPWAFQMLPRELSLELISQLEFTGCRRIEMLFPSSDIGLLKQYDVTTDMRQVRATVRQLQSAGIQVQARFWLGGPEEQAGEHRRVARMLKALRFCPFSLHAFPLALDAPLYAERAGAEGSAPALDALIAWTRDPWMVEKPVALWGGKEDIARIQRTIARIRMMILCSPLRRATRLVNLIRSRTLLAEIENRALSLLKRPAPPSS